MIIYDNMGFHSNSRVDLKFTESPYFQVQTKKQQDRSDTSVGSSWRWRVGTWPTYRGFFYGFIRKCEFLSFGYSEFLFARHPSTSKYCEILNVGAWKLIGNNQVANMCGNFGSLYQIQSYIIFMTVIVGLDYWKATYPK